MLTRTVLLVWGLVIIWFLATVIKSICNKLILSQNYDYPLVILCSQFFCVSLACYGVLTWLQTRSWWLQQQEGAVQSNPDYYHHGEACLHSSIIKLQPSFYCLILPYVLSNLSGHILSQLALFLLPIYMLKLTKSLEPLCTVFFARIWLKDVYHPLVYLSLVPIVLGVGMTSVDRIDGAWWGMLIGFLSSAAYALCRIFAKQVLDAKEMDSRLVEEKTHRSNSCNDELVNSSSPAGLSALHSHSLPPPSQPPPSPLHPSLPPPPGPPVVLALTSSPCHSSSICGTNATGAMTTYELTVFERSPALNNFGSEKTTVQESQRLSSDNDSQMSFAEVTQDEPEDLLINENTRLVEGEPGEMECENSGETASLRYRPPGHTRLDPITFSLHTNLVSFLFLLAFLLVSSLASNSSAPPWPSRHIILLLLANGLADILVSLGALYLLVFFDATTTSVISIARYPPPNLCALNVFIFVMVSSFFLFLPLPSSFSLFLPLPPLPPLLLLILLLFLIQMPQLLWHSSSSTS